MPGTYSVTDTWTLAARSPLPRHVGAYSETFLYATVGN
jgi:hypothetical protein